MTAGLGGMSGAQPKAGVITGCVAVVAEVSHSLWSCSGGSCKLY